jgi:hypothetical protein
VLGVDGKEREKKPLSDLFALPDTPHGSRATLRPWLASHGRAQSALHLRKCKEEGWRSTPPRPVSSSLARQPGRAAPLQLRGLLPLTSPSRYCSRGRDWRPARLGERRPKHVTDRTARRSGATGVAVDDNGTVRPGLSANGQVAAIAVNRSERANDGRKQSEPSEAGVLELAGESLVLAPGLRLSASSCLYGPPRLQSRKLTRIASIEHTSAPTATTSRADWVEPRLPVIIDGIADDWPALHSIAWDVLFVVRGRYR